MEVLYMLIYFFLYGYVKVSGIFFYDCFIKIGIDFNEFKLYVVVVVLEKNLNVSVLFVGVFFWIFEVCWSIFFIYINFMFVFYVWFFCCECGVDIC